MKQNNRLNKALHEALRDHPEPLHEAQWERLRADLDRDKKRKFPWFFLLTGAVLLASISTYILINTSSVPDHQLSVQSNTTESGSQNATQSNPDSTEQIGSSQQSPASGAQNSDNSKSTAPVSGNGHAGNGSGVISNPNNQPNKPIQSNSNPSQSNSNSSHSNQHGGSGSSPVNASGNPDITADLPAKNPITNNPTQNREPLDKKSHGKENSNDQTDSANDSRKITDNTNPDLPKTMQGKSVEPGSVDSHKPADDTQSGDSSKIKTNSTADAQTDDKKGDKSNVNKNPGKSPGNGGNDDKPSRMVFGFTGGISLATTKIVDLTNQKYFHKDTKKVFEENNQHQTSTFFNFSFEYKLKNFGLRFNSGLQYRSIYNSVNYDYRLNEVPWRNADNSIDTYFRVPDSSAMSFKINSKQALRFITIPLQLSYGFKLSEKYEMILNAGLNLSALVGAKGNALDLVNYETTSVSSMIKQKFTFGYTGGLQISRQLYNNWWLGLEANLGTINLAYNLGYGDLKSRIFNRSLSFQLRYKL